MLVGIYRTTDPNGKYLAVNRAYEKICAHNRIPFISLTANQPDFWEVIRKLDLFIFRWRQCDSHRQIVHDILPIVEGKLGISCFPDLNTCWHYDDKIREYLLLRALGFPMIESYVFWDKKFALRWIEDADFPVVFKLRVGAGSRNVILVKDRRRARKLVNRMFGKGIYPDRLFDSGNLRFQYFSLYRELHQIAGNLYRTLRGIDIYPFWQVQKNYLLFQKYIPDNRFDTRVTVIGDRAFIFRRLTRKGDFRASGSGLIDYDQDQVDLRCIEIALKISKELRFQSMAYDFLLTPENKPVFCEISYTFQSRAIYNCPGYYDRSLKFHNGHFWPEYLHLVDALGIPGLEQPEMDY